MAAVVKPFRWKPEFRKDGEGEGLEPDWADVESFFEDAEVLIELLALFHAAPTVAFASIPFRLHRRACLLLGNPGVHRSYSAKRRSWAFGLPPDPVEARGEAVDKAARAFANRDGERYRDCAPMITRLAEALARQGRFRTEDQILDVAIALERLYELHQGEISFKLKTRAASFLETQDEGSSGRVQGRTGSFTVRGTVRASFMCGAAREGRNRSRNMELERERQAAFDKGFDVARRTVVKLLKEGPPPDWNKMLLEAGGNGASGAPGQRQERPFPATGTGTARPSSGARIRRATTTIR